MRGLVILIAAFTLWAVDRFVFESRYSDAIWHKAQYNGQLFNYEVKRWLIPLHN